jgi:RNA polymerase sigma factor (sigma-70 family)
MTINNLYERARTGDSLAEAEMFKKLADRFWAIAHHRVWDKEEAEELVQNALATVISEYRQIEISSSFSAWAHKVLENKFLAYIQTRRRQHGREISLESSKHISNDLMPDPVLKMRLLNCLKQVSRANRRYARILNLHSLGFKRAEICEKLGMTMVQSYVVMSRARAMLKKCLDKGEGNYE